MATYMEFEKFVKSEYGAGASKDAPAGFMKLEVPLGSRSQLVFFARCGTDTVGEAVTLLSFVGEVKGSKLVEALTKATDLVIGGLVICNDKLALKHTILLENVDENEITIPLIAIAVTADVFEKQYVGGDEH